MGDGRSMIENELWRRVDAQVPKFDEIVEQLNESEKIQLARDAAAAIIGPLIWREMLGDDRLDTTQVTNLLGITRQALNKRVLSRTVLGVPGRGTTWFPAWQFDFQGQRIRGVLEPILRPWADAEADRSLPWDARRVLSWAATRQIELDELTPEQWILEGRDDTEVIAAARRAAKALSA